MKKLIAIIIGIGLMLSSITAIAEGSVQIVSDAHDYSMQIQAGGMTPYGTVIVWVQPDNAKIDIVHSAFLNQFVADSSGSVFCNIRFAEETVPGSYRVYCRDAATDTLFKSEPFLYTDLKKIQEAIDAVNASSESSIRQILETNCDTLALEPQLYQSLSPQEQMLACSMVHTQIPEDGFANMAQIQICFASCTALAALEGEHGTVAVLSDYGKIMGLDMQLLTSLTEQEQQAFVNICKEIRPESPQALCKIGEEMVFAAKIRCAKTAGELQEYFIRIYYDKLSLDKTAYNRVSNPSAVFSPMLQNSVTGYADASRLFNDAVKGALLNNTASSSGGGGSSASGKSTGLPMIAPISEVKTETPLYSDLADALWAKDYILLLTEKEIVSGDGSGKFRPNADITRAEFVKLLLNVFAISPIYEHTDFSDVTNNDWYYPYVAAACKAGIVNGISATYFGSGEFVSRQDMVVLCSRAIEYAKISMNGENTVAFSDAETIAEYAKDSVQSMVSIGIVSGDDTGAFLPCNYATRAESAKIAAMLLKLKEGER